MKPQSLVILAAALLLAACGPQPAAPAAVSGGPRTAAAGKRPDIPPNADSHLPALPPDSCPVTLAPSPAFVPPAPYLRVPSDGYFWYGTATLFTELPAKGVWDDPLHDENGYSQKLWWGREGYNWQAEPDPALTVTTKRLDAEVATRLYTDATNAYTPEDGSFMLTGGDFRTAGCWQVTGRYGETELSYVVWIAP
jgi:hypothetical protein